MTNFYSPAQVFGTYTHAQAVSENAQDEINANLVSLVGLLGATMTASGVVTEWNAPRSAGAAASPPNFNHIPEATRRLIINEIAAIAVGIEATATS